MAIHHWHLSIETIHYKRTFEGNIFDFKYHGLNYLADDKAGTLNMRVDQGDEVYVVIDSPIVWGSLEIFFPLQTPFPVAFANILGAGHPNPGTATFPMMGNTKDSTVTFERSGVFNFQIRIPLPDQNIFSNQLIWLDPQMIVSESTGGPPAGGR